MCTDWTWQKKVQSSTNIWSKMKTISGQPQITIERTSLDVGRLLRTHPFLITLEPRVKHVVKLNSDNEVSRF